MPARPSVPAGDRCPRRSAGGAVALALHVAPRVEQRHDQEAADPPCPMSAARTGREPSPPRARGHGCRRPGSVSTSSALKYARSAASPRLRRLAGHLAHLPPGAGQRVERGRSSDSGGRESGAPVHGTLSLGKTPRRVNQGPPPARPRTAAGVASVALRACCERRLCRRALARPPCTAWSCLLLLSMSKELVYKEAQETAGGHRGAAEDPSNNRCVRPRLRPVPEILHGRTSRCPGCGGPGFADKHPPAPSSPAA